MDQFIAFFLSKFPMVMTVFALLISLFSIYRNPNRSKSEIILGNVFFFAVGLSGLWGFICHAFYSNMASQYIGWQSSPFEFEVAVSNLGMGLVGLFGLRATKSYRIAGTLYTTSFLWGAAYGHIVQMIQTHNFAPGNAGFIFYNDLILPLILIIFILQSDDRRA